MKPLVEGATELDGGAVVAGAGVAVGFAVGAVDAVGAGAGVDDVDELTCVTMTPVSEVLSEP
jgi:hypothetical protein